MKRSIVQWIFPAFLCGSLWPAPMQKYADPKTGFGISYPAGWKTQSQADGVAFKVTAPDDSVRFLISRFPVKSRLPTETFLMQFQKQKKLGENQSMDTESKCTFDSMAHIEQCTYGAYPEFNTTVTVIRRGKFMYVLMKTYASSKHAELMSYGIEEEEIRLSFRLLP